MLHLRERIFSRVLNWVRSQGQMSLAKPALGNSFSVKAVEKGILGFFFFIVIIPALQIDDEKYILTPSYLN